MTGFTLSKGWWKSRTVWAGLIGTGFAILNAFGVLPAALTADNVVNTIMGVVGVAAVVFRFQADSTLTS